MTGQIDKPLERDGCQRSVPIAPTSTVDVEFSMTLPIAEPARDLA